MHYNKKIIKMMKNRKLIITISRELNISKDYIRNFYEQYKMKRKERLQLKKTLFRIEYIQKEKRDFIKGNLELGSLHPLCGKLRQFLGSNYNENSLQEFFKRFGRIPICPLTSKKINLNSNHLYSLDHIIPVSKGGPRTFDNMQVTLRIVNEMKKDHDLESFIQLCNLIAKINPRP